MQGFLMSEFSPKLISKMLSYFATRGIEISEEQATQYLKSWGTFFTIASSDGVCAGTDARRADPASYI